MRAIAHLGTLTGRLVRVQWNQADDLAWAASSCRMVDEVEFEKSNTDQPLTDDASLGLDDFREHFAIQARTQIRVDADLVDASIRVYSDDGFALAIYEAGSFSDDAEYFFVEPRQVVALAHPQPTGCKAFTKNGVTLKTGKIYTVDLRFWQRGGGKCLKVGCHTADASRCCWRWRASAGRMWWGGGLAASVCAHWVVAQRLLIDRTMCRLKCALPAKPTGSRWLAGSL